MHSSRLLIKNDQVQANSGLLKIKTITCLEIAQALIRMHRYGFSCSYQSWINMTKAIQEKGTLLIFRLCRGKIDNNT